MALFEVVVRDREGDRGRAVTVPDWMQGGTATGEAPTTIAPARTASIP